MSIFVRVNGCGNAWPVFLGTEHPFYDRMAADDLGSASFSIISCKDECFSSQAIAWEVVIDAGHNTVPFLLKNENRIPDALLLTHGHLDHILGADWIAQSLNYTGQRNEKLPLYATVPVQQQVLQTIPHIRHAVSFHALRPGRKKRVKQIPGLYVTAFPVYHGDNAHGSVMLLMEFEQGESPSTVLFTGDLLFPFLRNKDYKTISTAQALYIDCSNRFIYPASNHISFTAEAGEKGLNAEYRVKWQHENPLDRIVKKLLKKNSDQDYLKYLSEFMKENKNYDNVPFTIIEFLKETAIPNVQLVHYSGYHDRQYHQQEIMESRALQHWAAGVLQRHGMNHLSVASPKAGNIQKFPR